MKEFLTLTLLLTGFLPFSKAQLPANRPDAAYIFAYAPDRGSARTGLAFAWSNDGRAWNPIGPEHFFIYSDYGAWGSEKKMINPFLFADRQGHWQLVWSLNGRDDVFAHAASTDLVYWGRQSYPQTGTHGNIINPFIYQLPGKQYAIGWQSATLQPGEIFSAATDFKSFHPAVKINQAQQAGKRTELNLLGEKQSGTVHKVPFSVVESLLQAQKSAQHQSALLAESAAGDPQRFAALKPVDVSLTPIPGQAKKISDLLVGAFFEDINYAADGGLYAELVQNRDFEYHPADKKYRDKNWHHLTAWRTGPGSVSIDSLNPIHPNNPHYAVLRDDQEHPVLINEGFGGIALKAGEKYDCSAFIRLPGGKAGSVTWQLKDKNGNILGTAAMKVPAGGSWKKLGAVISSGATVADAVLELIAGQKGTVHIDMVSLFPQKTFKGRKNGLRADLARALADMKPKFLRFPGGCVAHGDGIDNIYRWKTTIGPLEARKPMRNMWNYHQTTGLGYLEYFQFCEDLGAEPLPVLAAGVPCQNSSTGGPGQQCGIPMADMDAYVQDILDLIEWANGDARTTRWGKIRAEAGHPKPFNLKYIGIGNEDLITDIFEERFTMIFKAIKKKYPHIKVIGTSGPFYEGTDYVEGWGIARKLGVDMIDEHYYVSPGWYIHNQDYYDKYDRKGSKVYLGEYASHLPGRPNNLETALTEALHLNNLERNGDIVAMASYAPLFAKAGFTQWHPDLIYFTNTEVKLTLGYYVQYLYGNSPGNEYIPATLQYSNNHAGVIKRISTSVVRNTQTNELYVRAVNLLPVAVNMRLHLDTFLIGKPVQKTVLGGNPADRSVLPVTNKVILQPGRPEVLAPYSLSMWRIPL